MHKVSMLAFILFFFFFYLLCRGKIWRNPPNEVIDEYFIRKHRAFFRKEKKTSHFACGGGGSFFENELSLHDIEGVTTSWRLSLDGAQFPFDFDGTNSDLLLIH